MANAVANKIHFEKYGLTAAFFTELQADVTELVEASEGQADAKRTGVGTTADSEAVLEDTLEVRGELKIAIENHYKNNPQKLAEWLTASHIKRRGETETPPTSPPAG